MMKRKPATALLMVVSPYTVAGDWGENWGSLLWGADSSPVQAVPVDGMWMFVVMSLVIAALGAFKMRKQ